MLTSASRTAMWTPVTLTDGSRSNYGFGWEIASLDGHRNFNHGGALPGFRAQLSRFPDDNLTVIVLTNADGAQRNTLADGIARTLFRGAPR